MSQIARAATMTDGTASQQIALSFAAADQNCKYFSMLRT